MNKQAKYYKDRYDKRPDIIEKRRKIAERKQEIYDIITMLRERGHTYQDIGKIYGLTKERIRQLLYAGRRDEKNREAQSNQVQVRSQGAVGINREQGKDQ